ncbi:MAG: class I SAM-dependent methyltransferase [Anaerocolumna sp.]
MSIEEIMTKWRLEEKNKQASIDLWNSMAQGFGSREIPLWDESRFLQLLQRNKMFNSDSAVLDVGCGAGNYSSALAKRCRKVVGVDLSPNMIKIARQKAVQGNIENVEYNCADWHEINLAEAGYEKKFDLVFAHMTPAVQSSDTFQKLSLASRGWCVLSKPTRRTDPVSDAVKKLVGITKKRESSDRDILYAFELLWYQGLQPHFEYEQQHWNLRKTLEEAYELYINRVLTYRDITREEEQGIKAYLNSIVKDGFLCGEVDTTITTLYWHI